MPIRMTAVAIQGCSRGKIIRRNILIVLAPSILADSSSVTGMEVIKPVYWKIVVLEYAPPQNISRPQGVYISPSMLSVLIMGTSVTTGGTMMPIRAQPYKYPSISHAHPGVLGNPAM